MSRSGTVGMLAVLLLALPANRCRPGATVTTLGSSLAVLHAGQTATLTATTSGAGAGNAIVRFAMDPATCAMLPAPPQVTATPDGTGAGGVATVVLTAAAVPEDCVVTLNADVPNSSQTAATTSVTIRPQIVSLGYTAAGGWVSPVPAGAADIITITPSVTDSPRGKKFSYALAVSGTAPIRGLQFARMVFTAPAVAANADVSIAAGGRILPVPAADPSASYEAAWTPAPGGVRPTTSTIVVDGDYGVGGTTTFTIRLDGPTPTPTPATLVLTGTGPG